ncbi:hypothetical protein GCM10029992_57500 [Glycomyces albus]
MAARGGRDLTTSDMVFEAAPVELARAISLQHTVALIQVVIDVVEDQVPALAAEGEEGALRESVLLFSREIAFAAARVYARAAETRGAWDARLQAMLVDALLRGDSPTSWSDAPRRSDGRSRNRSRWCAGTLPVGSRRWCSTASSAPPAGSGSTSSRASTARAWSCCWAA